MDLSEDDEKESLLSLSIGGAHRLRSSLSWDFTGTFTRGTLDRFGPDATFETSEDDEDTALEHVRHDSLLLHDHA